MSVKRIKCLWHQEDTPSLVIYLEKGYAKCFGCGVFKHLRELPVGYLEDVDICDFIPTPKEDLSIKLNYISSLPKESIRGLTLHSDKNAYYLVWPNNDYYLARSKDAGRAPKYKGPSGYERPIFYSLFNRSTTLILTEGEINALSIGEAFIAKKDPSLNVASFGSATQFKKTYRHELNKYSTIIVIFDNDPAGRLGGCRFLEMFNNLKAKIKVLFWEKDANDILISEGVECLYNKVKQAI